MLRSVAALLLLSLALCNAEVSLASILKKTFFIIHQLCPHSVRLELREQHSRFVPIAQRQPGYRTHLESVSPLCDGAVGKSSHSLRPPPPPQDWVRLLWHLSSLGEPIMALMLALYPIMSLIMETIELTLQLNCQWESFLSAGTPVSFLR